MIWPGRASRSYSVIKEHLMSLGGRIAYDHLVDITHLYRVADRNNKFEAIGGNPCAKITVPGKPEHKKRPPFTDDEARLILVECPDGGAGRPVVALAERLYRHH